MMAYKNLRTSFPKNIIDKIRKTFSSTSTPMSNNSEEEKNQAFPRQTHGKKLNFVNTAASTFELDPNPTNNVSKQVFKYQLFLIEHR
jgi:hypothetical protein